MGVALASWPPKIRPSAFDRSGIGPDHHQGHGRTSPRHQRRHAARPTRSKPTSARRRWPIANTSPARRHRLHPQEAVGRFGPVRPREDRVRAGRTGSGFVFENEDQVGGNVPKEYIPGVEKGIASPPKTARSPASRSSTSRSTLIDGAYHDVDSSALAFEIARARVPRSCAEGGHQAARADHEGRSRDPGRILGDVIGDLNSVVARSRAQTCRGNAQVINAMVPLANMFGYVNTAALVHAGPRQLHDAVRPLREVPANVATK
jgi:elongation factor G